MLPKPTPLESPLSSNAFNTLASSNVPSTERRGIANGLSEESFQTLVHLMTDKNDFVKGVKWIRNLDKGYKTSFPKNLISELNTIAEDYSRQVESYQGLDNAADLLYNLNNECARAVQTKLNNAIETSGNDVDTVMCLQAAKCIFQYYISDESVPHETNIEAAKITLGHEWYSTHNGVFNEDFYKKFSLSDVKEQTIGLQRRLVTACPGCISEHLCEDINYTIFSPQFFKSLIRAIDDARSNALSNCVLTSYNLRGLCSDGADYSDVHLEREGGNLIVTWSWWDVPFPPQSSKDFNRFLKCFKPEIKPYRTLLKELGGSIECKYDSYPYRDPTVIIKFPEAKNGVHLLQKKAF